MTLKYIQTATTSLYSGISASATSVRITPYPLDLDGVKLVTADFGTTGYATIDPKISGYEEIISFTGITDNGDNTATLTGVTRSLGSKYPYTTTSNGKVHGSSAVVVFSDNPQLFNDLINYINGISIVGAANASTIVQGLLQLPSTAQINAGTATGSTGAPLAVTPDALAASIYGLQLPSSGQKSALVGNGNTPSASNPFMTLLDLAFTAGVDQSQATSNGTQKVGESNATTKASIIAEKFVPTVTGIQGVKLWKIADTGSFTGTVKIALQVDSAGSPSGADLASYTISNAAWLKLTAAAEFAVSFTTEYTAMVAGNSYWIVVTPSTSDNSNHPNLGLNTAGGYASGVLKYNNSADGWVSVATSILYFKTTQGILNKIPKTSTTTGLFPQSVLSYSLVAMDTTTVNVASSSTATTVYSKLIEGGFFTINSGIRLRIGITAVGSTVTSTSSTLDIKYNGNIIATEALTGVSNLQSNGSDNITRICAIVEAIIINQGSLSSQKYLVLDSQGTTGVTAHASTYSAAATPTANSASSGTSAVDFSQPGLLEIVLTNSNTQANTFTYVGAIIEKIG